MRKIRLIIYREYLTRVRKRSFIIMSILGPILFASMMIIPAWLAQMEETELKKFAVIDSSNVFTGVIPDSKYLTFDYLDNVRLSDLKSNFDQLGYYGILYINPGFMFWKRRMF